MTKSEKEWIKKREEWAEPHNGYGDEGYFCEHCKINCFDGCPTEIRDGNINAFVDALDFSERVAVKLARMSVDAMLPCFQTNGDCPYTNPNCAWCRLMVARLLVEEEMNGEKDNS